jgi:hypothetical protein
VIDSGKEAVGASDSKAKDAPRVNPLPFLYDTVNAIPASVCSQYNDGMTPVCQISRDYYLAVVRFGNQARLTPTHKNLDINEFCRDAKFERKRPYGFPGLSVWRRVSTSLYVSRLK